MSNKVKNKKKGQKKTTSAQAWKNQLGTPLDVPSGNTALVKPSGMQAFLDRGFIPNPLLKIVTEAIESGKPPKMEKLEINEDTLAEFSEMIDKVTIASVIEPQVHPIPPPVVDPETGVETPGERDGELLYIDEVDMNDKIFIFQFAVGGTRDLERFRKEQAASMGAFQPREVVEG